MLTWLSPGAGLGYVFMVVVFASVVLFIFGVASALPAGGRGVGVDKLAAVRVHPDLLFGFLYGLCRLCMLLIGRNNGAPMVVSVSIMVVLNLVIQVIPYYVASYFNDFTRISYECTNPSMCS